jgi:hypothetical protein
MKLVSISTLVPRRAAISILAASALAIALPQSGFAQDVPWVGTWKLNLARSTHSAGPAPRSSTLTIRGAGANLTGTVEAIDAQGRPTRVVIMYIYDGQPHPTTGSPDFDARAYTRVDANTVIYTRMKAGKLVGVGTQVFSQDGRTLTGTFIGVDAAGQPGNYVQVYEKQ